MKELPLITFEQAKKLKELGFDWDTKFYFDFIGHECSSHSNINYNKSVESIYSRPTTALALKWLRDEKEIDVLVLVDKANNYYYSHIENYLGSEYDVNVETKHNSETYEQAESEGLDYTLDYLLKELK